MLAELLDSSYPGSPNTTLQTVCRLDNDTSSNIKIKLEIAQSEQDVSPFCKESDMTYS